MSAQTEGNIADQSGIRHIVGLRLLVLGDVTRQHLLAQHQGLRSRLATFTMGVAGQSSSVIF